MANKLTLGTYLAKHPKHFVRAFSMLRRIHLARFSRAAELIRSAYVPPYSSER